MMFLRLRRARIRIAAAAAMGAWLLLLCACTPQDSTRATPTESPSPPRSTTPAQATSPAPDAPNSERTAIAEVRSDRDGSRPAPVGSVADLTIQAQAYHQPTLGGEQQRVAITRALVKHPFLILADEPTGQLDTLTGASTIALLRDIVDRTGVTVIVASHDPKVHEGADLTFDLMDGRRIEQDARKTVDSRNPDPLP